MTTAEASSARKWMTCFIALSAFAVVGSAAAGNQQPKRGLAVRAAVQVQRRPVRRQDSSKRVENAATFRTERQSLQRLRTAEELLAERRFAEAVRYLGSILEADEDYFFQPDADAGVYRSLKSEAHRLIGRMPAEGRASYQLQYGARAHKLLADAVAEGDIQGVAEVTRRFFHTDAGYEATYLLGTYYLDGDRPLAAALCLARLVDAPQIADQLEPALSVQLATCWLRAGRRDKAEQSLVRVRARWPNRTVRVAGEELRLFEDDEQAVEWLIATIGPQSPRGRAVTDDWTMHRGVPSRNAASSGSSPLLERQWRVPVANDPYVEDMVAKRHAMYLQQGATLIPSLQPLAVDGVVLMRTTQNLLAVDFRTGKRLWEVPVEETLEQSVRSFASQPSRTDIGFVTALDQRVWVDLAYGTMSSDGAYVFSVEDLPLQALTANRRVVFRANGARQLASSGPRPYNRLAAHDIRTGKLKWELGGPNGDFELRLAGTTFLGPPLPLGDRLYVLSDAGGEIRLLALDPASGDIDWSQQLAVAEWNVSQDPIRRLSGVSPSYADGVLVCPTSAGAVVAVDLTTRSLLWGYRYGRSRSVYASRARARVGVGGLGGRQLSRPVSGTISGGGRWMESAAVISDGRILLTPIESDELFCIDLLEGTQLWRKPRNESLYVAGVVDGNVYLIGQSSVRALRLADGEPAWPSEQLELPADSAPSGRGYLSGLLYYLPLSTAEVATIDLQQGRIIARSKSRKGHIPGNLICYRGSIVSQSVEGVERFHQLAALEQDVSRRLETDPADARALALRGEISLHEGRVADALGDLERSFGLQDDPHTRELLIDALLDALQVDFAGHRQAAERLQPLMDRPEQRAAYLRLMARGLEQAGEYLAAFDTYMQLLDPELGEPEIERVEPSHSVRRDRWFQANLASLRQHAPPADRDAMDQTVAQRLQAARLDDSADAMREALRYFGNHPAAADAQQWLAEKLLQRRELLEAELLLNRLSRAPQERHRHAAVALMARMLSDTDRTEDAAVYYRRLAGELADVVCLEDKTGGQLVGELKPDSPVRRVLDSDMHWPEGHVDVRRESSVVAPQRYFHCELRGDLGPFFSDTIVELDRTRLALIGRNGFGQQIWRQSLMQPGPRSLPIATPITTEVVHGKVAGHLLLVSTGRQLFAIDTLGAGMNQTSRLLWHEHTSEPIPGDARARTTVHANFVTLAWGGRRTGILDASGQPTGQLGPVTSQFACFQRDRNLVAVDSFTGETLWIRHNFENGSDVFGDDERLFVVPRNGKKATVLRSLDGSTLGHREVPPADSWMTTLAGRLLTFRIEAEKNGDDPAKPKSIIEMIDPWEQKTLWRREFRGKIKAWFADATALAVVEPGPTVKPDAAEKPPARFVLLGLPDGEIRIDSPIVRPPSLNAVYAMTSPDVYVLIVNRQSTAAPNRVSISPVPGGGNNKLVQGHVYGFDRKSGKKLWSREVENQAIVLDQPSRLPAFVLASRVYQRTRAGGRGRTPQYPVMCLDKRTGRILHQEQLNTHITAFDIRGEPDRNRVELRLPRESIEMTFTNEPDPADEPENNEKPSAAPDEKAQASVPRGESQ